MRRSPFGEALVGERDARDGMACRTPSSGRRGARSGRSVPGDCSACGSTAHAGRLTRVASRVDRHLDYAVRRTAHPWHARRRPLAASDARDGLQLAASRRATSARRARGRPSIVTLRRPAPSYDFVVQSVGRRRLDRSTCRPRDRRWLAECEASAMRRPSSASRLVGCTAIASCASSWRRRSLIDRPRSATPPAARATSSTAARERTGRSCADDPRRRRSRPRADVRATLTEPAPSPGDADGHRATRGPTDRQRPRLGADGRSRRLAASGRAAIDPRPDARRARRLARALRPIEPRVALRCSDARRRAARRDDRSDASHADGPASRRRRRPSAASPSLASGASIARAVATSLDPYNCPARRPTTGDLYGYPTRRGRARSGRPDGSPPLGRRSGCHRGARRRRRGSGSCSRCLVATATLYLTDDRPAARALRSRPSSTTLPRSAGRRSSTRDRGRRASRTTACGRDRLDDAARRAQALHYLD